MRKGDIDGVLALNSLSGIQAVKGVRAIGRSDAVKVATFDLGPDVLRAVRARQLLFAVDQQAYLQGYLPIVLLTERARYGLFPAQGDVLPTGPNFVTAPRRGQGDRAEQALDPVAVRRLQARYRATPSCRSSRR